jgi:hypothetical protein
MIISRMIDACEGLHARVRGARRNDVSMSECFLAKMAIGAQHEVMIFVGRPALLAAPRYAPLPSPARFAGIPTPAPAGYEPELA